MIDRDKLKIMARLAIYEKKKGKKDLLLYTYEKDDYIRFQWLKTAVLVTLAFVVLAAFAVLWHMGYILNHFDVLNYEGIIAAGIGIYIVVMILYLFLTYKSAADACGRSHERIGRYQEELQKLKEIYDEEDRQQQQFEKGKWRNGQ